MIRGRRPHPGRQISLDLLERLYDMDYAQGILEKDALKHRFHVEPLAKIVGTEIVRAPTGPRVRLWLQNPRTGDKRLSERSFDLVVASEYSAKPAAELLLAPLAPLLDKGADMTVDRDYRINFGRQASLGRGVGLWWLDALAEHEVSVDEDVLPSPLCTKADFSPHRRKKMYSSILPSKGRGLSNLLPPSRGRSRASRLRDSIMSQCCDVLTSAYTVVCQWNVGHIETS